MSHRKRFLRKTLRSSVFIAICVVATLTVLLVMYCGMRDNPNLLHLLVLGLPAFSVVGVIVGAVNFFMARRDYDRNRK